MRLPRTDKQLKVLLALGLLQLLLGLLFARWRFMTADEGFYNIAAREVMQGRTPYRDFFYPQSFLLPYVYGLYQEYLSGYSFWAARSLSVLFTTLGGVIVYLLTAAKTNRAYAIGAWLAYIFAEMVLGWYGTAQTYALSVFLLLCSWYAAEQALRSQSRGAWWAMGAGLALALVFNCRSFLVVAALPVLIILAGAAQPRKLIWCGTLGFVLGFWPNLLLIYYDWENYYFNNYLFHAGRSSLEAAAVWPQKLRVLQQLLFSVDLQFGLLFVLTLGHAVLSLRQRRWPDPAFFFFTVIFLINLAPQPVWQQYFSVNVPFMIICAALCLHRLGGKRLRYLLVTVYFAAALSAEKYVTGGERLRSFRLEHREYFSISQLNLLSAELDGYLSEGDLVYAQWPGFALQTQGRIVPRFENQFWVRVGPSLTEAQSERHRLGSEAELRRLLSAGEPKLVIFNNRRNVLPRREILERHYQRVPIESLELKRARLELYLRK